jgi:ribosome-binding protein aMBF1 (putative translation factor)
MMPLTEIDCPFCKKKFFRNLNSSLLPRSEIHVCDKCIARGLEERQYKEPEPEEELGNKLYNPSQRKTSDSEIQELKDLIREEYLNDKGREPSESEMRMELRKWIWLAEKDSE